MNLFSSFLVHATPPEGAIAQTGALGSDVQWAVLPHLILNAQALMKILIIVKFRL